MLDSKNNSLHVIDESPEKKLPVREIYSRLLVKNPALKEKGKRWYNSVRHALSYKPVFSIYRPKGEVATTLVRGNYWCINENYRYLLESPRQKRHSKPQELLLAQANVREKTKDQFFKASNFFLKHFY